MMNNIHIIVGLSFSVCNAGQERSQRTNDLLLNLDSLLLKLRVVAVVCWVCCFNLFSCDSNFSSSCFAYKVYTQHIIDPILAVRLTVRVTSGFQ